MCVSASVCVCAHCVRSCVCVCVLSARARVYVHECACVCARARTTRFFASLYTYMIFMLSWRVVFFVFTHVTVDTCRYTLNNKTNSSLAFWPQPFLPPPLLSSHKKKQPHTTPAITLDQHQLTSFTVSPCSPHIKKPTHNPCNNIRPAPIDFLYFRNFLFGIDFLYFPFWPN